MIVQTCRPSKAEGAWSTVRFHRNSHDRSPLHSVQKSDPELRYIQVLAEVIQREVMLLPVSVTLLYLSNT